MGAQTTWADGLSLSVCLQDSVLAFWSHGLQGRSLDTNEVQGLGNLGGSSLFL